MMIVKSVRVSNIELTWMMGHGRARLMAYLRDHGTGRLMAYSMDHEMAWNCGS